MAKKPCTGDIVVIDGKRWCVGEKIISKWKHSKRNKKMKKTKSKTKKNVNKGKRKTIRSSK
jgi:hypothetical protein